MEPKIALVYDRINKIGGAERVLQALHHIWPKSPLYTGVYHPQKASWAKDIDVRPSFLNRISFFRDKHEYLAPLMPYAFESFDFSEFDIVISVTSAECKGILTKPHQLHVCYLLTPTRYLWSHTHHYQGRGLKTILYRPIMSSLRRWDYVASKRPDHIVPISNLVKSRTTKYYQRSSEKVIYPPVRFKYFCKHPKVCQKPDYPYYLVVSRLVSYKSIHKLIKVFPANVKEKLVIIGAGKEAPTLKDLDNRNTIYMGKVSDEHLNCLYHHANALIMPQIEDFGIVSLEAQAAGIPVITLSQSGAAETIVPKKTGLLINSINIHNLKKAMDAIENHTWYDKSIRRHAKKYRNERFEKEFKNHIEELWQKHTKK